MVKEATKTSKEKEEVKPGDPRKLADLELHLCGPQAHFFASSQLGSFGLR
jgi:hypothetical protein